MDASAIAEGNAFWQPWCYPIHSSHHGLHDLYIPEVREGCGGVLSGKGQDPEIDLEFFLIPRGIRTISASGGKSVNSSGERFSSTPTRTMHRVCMKQPQKKTRAGRSFQLRMRLFLSDLHWSGPWRKIYRLRGMQSLLRVFACVRMDFTGGSEGV